MEVLDVKNIMDIPEIEDYLSKEFTLDCYDSEDNIQCYTYPLTETTAINLEIISDEPLICGIQELAEILTQEPIYYVGWATCIEAGEIAEILTMYHYRPMMDNKDKTFYKPKQ